MRKVIMMFALAMGIATANAQENVTVGQSNGSDQPTLTKEVYPQKEADGGERHPCEGNREELPERNQHVCHHGGREFLHLQCAHNRGLIIITLASD